jgi:hypothetical protein
VTGRWALLVEGPGEFAIRGSGGLKFLGAFFELMADVDDGVLQLHDLALQTVNIRWCFETGLGPCALAHELGELRLQLADAR